MTLMATPGSVRRRMRLFFTAGIFGLSALTLMGRDAAALPPPAQLSQADLQDVARLEEYLNGLTTVSARFQQYNDKAGLAWGKIWLRRPGQMRVEYDPPQNILLVADGILVSYYDREINQINQVPLNATPAWFLLRDEIRLTDDLTITNFEKSPGALRLDMYQTDDPDAGSVSLIFSDSPLELKQWTLTDTQGNRVRIGLFEVRFGEKLRNDLFATPQRESDR